MQHGNVTITEESRSGSVVYSEARGSIKGWWEFAGGDAIAIVNMGSVADWRQAHPWAVERRSAILRVVADGVIRQKAPGGIAEIDDEHGAIVLRQGGTATAAALSGTTAAEARAATFVRRYSKLKAMLGLGVLAVVLVAGAALWIGKNGLAVAPTSSVPLGECVRTDRHIASLLQSTDPHLPEISGRGGNTTTSISILLIPLDGSEPRVIPVVAERSGGSFSLARIMGSDGRTLWFDATGLHGVRLNGYELITSEDLREANPSVDPGWWEDARGMDIVDGRLHNMNADRSAAMDIDPATWKAKPVAPKPSNARFERHEPVDLMAAGFIVSPGTWLGLHTAPELEGAFKPGQWIRPVESADGGKQLRRLCKAELEASSDTAHYRIRSIAPVGGREYPAAAFLRLHAASEPLRLSDPDGALMVHTSTTGLNGTLMIARVDTQGTVIWSADTGLDRFSLQQILPGADAVAFVGTRPPVPDELSEPLLVIVENATGSVRTLSLWR